MCYSALAVSGHYCLQVTIAPAYPISKNLCMLVSNQDSSSTTVQNLKKIGRGLCKNGQKTSHLTRNDPRTPNH